MGGKGPSSASTEDNKGAASSAELFAMGTSIAEMEKHVAAIADAIRQEQEDGKQAAISEDIAQQQQQVDDASEQESYEPGHAETLYTTKEERVMSRRPLPPTRAESAWKAVCDAVSGGVHWLQHQRDAQREKQRRDKAAKLTKELEQLQCTTDEYERGLMRKLAEHHDQRRQRIKATKERLARVRSKGATAAAEPLTAREFRWARILGQIMAIVLGFCLLSALSPGREATQTITKLRVENTYMAAKIQQQAKEIDDLKRELYTRTNRLQEQTLTNEYLKDLVFVPGTNETVTYRDLALAAEEGLVEHSAELKAAYDTIEQYRHQNEALWDMSMFEEFMPGLYEALKGPHKDFDPSEGFSRQTRQNIMHGLYLDTVRAAQNSSFGRGYIDWTFDTHRVTIKHITNPRARDVSETEFGAYTATCVGLTFGLFAFPCMYLFTTVLYLFEMFMGGKFLFGVTCALLWGLAMAVLFVFAGSIYRSLCRPQKKRKRRLRCQRGTSTPTPAAASSSK